MIIRHNGTAIDPFPIIGFYLYHVISADQSNNWTTSGMWSCYNLLLILNAFHLYLWRLKHKPKRKWQLYVAQLYMMTKSVNFISYLSNLRWTKPWRLLFKWYVYRHILPQLFPLLLTKALVRWRVFLRVYTIYWLSQQECPKITQKSVCLYANFSEKRCLDLSGDISPYMRTFSKGIIYG